MTKKTKFYCFNTNHIIVKLCQNTTLTCASLHSIKDLKPCVMMLSREKKRKEKLYQLFKYMNYTSEQHSDKSFQDTIIIIQCLCLILVLAVLGGFLRGEDVPLVSHSPR